MRPISTIRSVRDEFSGDLTLNFRIKLNLNEVFSGYIDFIRGKDHGIDHVLRMGGKKRVEGVELIP